MLMDLRQRGGCAVNGTVALRRPIPAQYGEKPFGVEVRRDEFASK